MYIYKENWHPYDFFKYSQSYSQQKHVYQVGCGLVNKSCVTIFFLPDSTYAVVYVNTNKRTPLQTEDIVPTYNKTENWRQSRIWVNELNFYHLCVPTYFLTIKPLRTNNYISDGHT